MTEPTSLDSVEAIKDWAQERYDQDILKEN